MISLLQRARRAIISSPQAAAHGLFAQHAGDGVAQQLLERADASAGRDPCSAQELRDAAHAYLRVVR